MIRKIVWTSIGAVLIIAGITAAWTQAQPWRMNRGPVWFHHGPLGYVAGELELSEAQKSQIKSIWDGERPNIAELIREFASEQKEMDAVTLQGGAQDQARIQKVATRQGATLAKLIVEKEKLTGRIYFQVLNPVQRSKADEIRRRWDSHLEGVVNRIGNATSKK